MLLCLGFGGGSCGLLALQSCPFVYVVICIAYSLTWYSVLFPEDRHAILFEGCVYARLVKVLKPFDGPALGVLPGLCRVYPTPLLRVRIGAGAARH